MQEKNREERQTNHAVTYLTMCVRKNRQKGLVCKKGGKQTNLKTDAINLWKKALACSSARTIQTHRHKGKRNRQTNIQTNRQTDKRTDKRPGKRRDT